MIRSVLIAGVAFAMAGCAADEPRNPLADLDAELQINEGDAADPAVMAALHDPIMVDPTLSGRSNANAVRPPSLPYAAPMPPSDVARRGGTAEIVAREKLMSAPAPNRADGCPQCDAKRDSTTLAALAQSQPVGAGCASAIRYSQGWATRLPADLPLLPNVRLVEAAGVQDDACSLRAVSFWTDLPMGTALDWYFTRASQAGYTSRRQADSDGEALGGTRPDGGAYVVFMKNRSGGGTEIDLIVNNGN